MPIAAVSTHSYVASLCCRSSGDGRVVTRCRLEDLQAETDAPDARMDTSARRIILSHDSTGTIPPGLFLFDAAPKVEEEDVFTLYRKWKSSLDVWFEDTKAVDLAFGTVVKSLREAKAYRGQRITQYLAQGEDSSYPMSRAM